MLDVSMEVYKALRTLFTTLLVPGEEGSPTEIIAAYQNANCPKMPYLAISKPSFKLLGSSPFTQAVVETTVPGEDGEPDTVVHTQTRVSTFLGTATVTEVGGAGNMLSYVAMRLSDPVVRELLYTLKLSVDISEDTYLMPKLSGSGYIDEYTTQVKFNYAIAHDIETPIITSVDFIENIVLVPNF